MNILPFEIQSYICEFACVDDGRTARSLDLVSRRFRDVVIPFRFQSIAVAGHQQISELGTRLASAAPHLRRVRNVFISESARNDEAGENQVQTKHGIAQITQLIGLVSSTVETMTVHYDNPRFSTSLIAFLFGLHYPNLRELTVIGYYPFLYTPNSMPQLTHLHLNGNRNPHGLLQMGGLDAACPELKHLRISGVSRAVSFVRELSEALRTDDDSLFPAKLPTNVCNVYVQPSPATHPPSPKISNIRLVNDTMQGQLERLTRDENLKNDLQFHLLKACDSDIRSTSRLEWLNRLEGGDGCWKS